MYDRVTLTSYKGQWDILKNVARCILFESVKRLGVLWKIKQETDNISFLTAAPIYIYKTSI